MMNDLVYLAWNDSKKNKKYIIAKLYKKKKIYHFEYITQNVEEAKKDGFNLLISFPDENKIYTNNRLFATFSSRLPDKRRPDINKILTTYQMEGYDEFELLKRSGAKLPTDNFEFVMPNEIA